MAIRTVEKRDWETYLNRISKKLGACLAEVEVAGLDIGDQIEAEWATLAGISYDPKDDVVAMELVSQDDKHVGRLVNKPVELVVDEAAEGLASLVVADTDGERTILKLKKPLALPPA